MQQKQIQRKQRELLHLITTSKLKVEVDKIDVDKLETVPVDLSKLSNVVNNEVVKKTVYDKIAAKVNAIDTDYDAEILGIKFKYFATANYNRFTNEKLDLEIKQKELVNKSDIVDLVNNADLNKKSSKISNKS